jgi:hypothetical protein
MENDFANPDVLWCRKNNPHAQYFIASVDRGTINYKVPDDKRTLSMPVKEWQDVMIRAIPEDFDIY